MRYETITTLANETYLITPLEEGQALHFGGDRLTAPAGEPIRVYGTGPVEISQGKWGNRLRVTGEYDGPYFDGSYSPDPDLTPSWVGTANASASVLSGTRPAEISAPAAGQGQTYQTGDSPVTGSKAQRFMCLTTFSAGIPCMQGGSITTGTMYTMVMWVRVSRAITVHPRIRAVTSGVDGTTLQPGVWTLVRTTVTAGSGGDNQTGLLIDGNSGHQIGDTIDIDNFTIVEGAHPWLMPFHGGLTPDDDMYTLWTGAEDASTSTLNARVPEGVGDTPATQRLSIQTTENTDLRIIRTENNLQASYGATLYTTVPGDVGKTFTAFARVRIPEGYDPTDDVATNESRSRSLYLFGSANTYYSQAPAVPGTYDLKMMFQVTESGQTVRLGGGGAVGQSVYYESFYLFEGEPDFFDPHNMPRQMATDISGLTQPHYIPVPKGYTLWVAYGANAVAMVANGAQQLDPYTWYSFTTGTDFAWTGISPGTSAVGAIAIMTKNGEQRPEIEWSPGKGNSGLRFVGKPNIQGISAKLRDGLVSGSAQLREVGLWEQ